MIRRLGERLAYEEKVGLARAVHHDYHEWMSLLRAQAAIGYELEDLSRDGHEEPLPAGPETAPWVKPRKVRWGPHDFPRPHIIAEMERDTGWRAVAVAKVEAAVEKLRDYEPHGEILAMLVGLACLEGDVIYHTGHSWKHRGKLYRAAMELAGAKHKLWNDLTLAWGIVALYAVDRDVLTAAQDAGAINEKALARAFSEKVAEPVAAEA